MRLRFNIHQGFPIIGHLFYATWGFKDQIGHQGPQLQRIASYLHSWADFYPNRLEGFSWILPLNILTALYFQADNERDDKSLARTASAIIEAVPCDFQWRFPFGGEHDLPWFLWQHESWRFLQALEVLAEKGRLAVRTKDKVHACAIWRSLLGERFPVAGLANRKFDVEVKNLQLNWNCFKGINPIRWQDLHRRPGHP